MENALPRNKNQRAIEKSFLKRKDCIKKKSMELSVLCDVKVCAIIVGPDGRVETWPESHDDVRQVIQAYKNCPVDKKKRERPQELDHGGSNKKQKVCAVSEGVKRTGFTDEDVLRSIDAKLCEVRKRIELIKSNDQKRSFFQETASFGQSPIINNSTCFDTQGFEENDLFDWCDVFNAGSENPQDNQELFTAAPTPTSLNPCSGLTDTDQDFQSSTPTVNSLTPGCELMDTFSVANNGEFNQFAQTDLNSFISGSESVNSFTLPGNQCFKPNRDWFEDSAFLADLISWDAAPINIWT
ncbi:agamous-like MADS-box AGL81 [Olea europaea subsp. europaea]|uniref:Agamous-like MADS-box AGL81 n=1 Tax=Olea europaea subsp. europaea TaxID=158383 RepID=A0A8S0SR64_OLEEU|nr:agamous-like MADS-box AGL81 [Olea europaea subsp. europaea]